MSAGQLQPKGGLMAQANRLGPEVGGHLALWAAFISHALVTTVVSSVVLEIVGVIIIIIILDPGEGYVHAPWYTNNTDLRYAQFIYNVGAAMS